MRALGLSELHRLSDRQLERVVAACEAWRRECSRVRILRMRALTPRVRVEATDPRPALLASIDAKISVRRDRLRQHSPGLLGRLGLVATVYFEGTLYRESAARLTAEIVSLQKQRADLQAQLITPTTEVPASSAIEDPPDPDHLLRIQIDGKHYTLDMRLKPTGFIRKIQSERQRAKRTGSEPSRQKLGGQGSGGSRASQLRSDAAQERARRAESKRPSKTAVDRRGPHGAADRAELSRIHPSPPVKWGNGRSSYMRSKVYVLQLECGKYYVGKCTSFPRRVKYHIEGRGALWTQLYRPVASHAFFWGEEEAEKAVTLHYMDEFGEQNVRGWAFAKGGDYNAGWIKFQRMKCAPPLSIQQLAVCTDLRPMQLPRSAMWDANRLRGGVPTVFEDVKPW